MVTDDTEPSRLFCNFAFEFDFFSVLMLLLVGDCMVGEDRDAKSVERKDPVRLRSCAVEVIVGSSMNRDVGCGTSAGTASSCSPRSASKSAGVVRRGALFMGSGKETAGGGRWPGTAAEADLSSSSGLSVGWRLLNEVVERILLLRLGLGAMKPAVSPMSPPSSTLSAATSFFLEKMCMMGASK